MAAVTRIDDYQSYWRNIATPDYNHFLRNDDDLRSAFHCAISLFHIPLEAVRRLPNTPIWKLEAALKCRSCRTPRYAPPVHMIRLTEIREIAPYLWVHPDDER
jgi:hypothetical protein